MLMQNPKFTNKADFLEFTPYYDITYYYDKSKNEIVESEFYVGD